MYCVNCGSYNDNGVVFCSSCGARLSSPNSNSQQQHQPYQGYSNYSQPYSKPVNYEKADVLVIIGCVLWPILGVILYLVWREEKPVAAKTCGKAALISFLSSIVVGVLFYIIILASLLSAASSYSLLLLL